MYFEVMVAGEQFCTCFYLARFFSCGMFSSCTRTTTTPAELCKLSWKLSIQRALTSAGPTMMLWDWTYYSSTVNCSTLPPPRGFCFHRD